MATTKNITMKQFNGTDYDTLYPKTIASQINDVYSKNETLSNATKTLFGLGSTAIPDSVFAYIHQKIEDLASVDVKIATGSYTGTGTYGASNPNSLTFDFIPKMIYVRNTNRTMTDYGFMFIPVFCLSDTFNSSGYFIYESASSNEYAKIDESTKKVYWYSASASASNSVNAQFNISGNTYEYFAIG